MNKENLGELIIASEDTMYRVAKSILASDADCADAIQETIVIAFTKRLTLKKDKYAKTWLIRILINECYQMIRDRKRIVSFEDYQLEERETMDPNYSDLYQSVQALPQKERIVVLLYYFEEYRVKEIARILDITESAVKNRLCKARGRLKNDLKEEVL